MAPTAATERHPTPRTRVARLWRFTRTAVVFLFVAWHLMLLLVRNPLDLWYEPIRAWAEKQSGWERHGRMFRRVDIVTWKYANLVGCEQGWTMFTPPLARRAPFLGVRIEFADGSSELVRSFNEPDPTSFFRVGGWQMRKLEDYLGHSFPDDLDKDPNWPLWPSYAQHALRRWQGRNPDDPRPPRRLVLLRRFIYFPEPGAGPAEYDEPTERVLVVFHPDGRVWR
jgi:hypothetical protein